MFGNLFKKENAMVPYGTGPKRKLGHVSPKQDFTMFSRLVNAIRPKVVIPHHYDIWEALMKKSPEMFQGVPLPLDQITPENILGIIKGHLEEDCKTTEFFAPVHHVWYLCGFGVEEIHG